MADDEISQETADAIITKLGETAAFSGHLDGLMDVMTPVERASVEESFERHGAQRRADGEPGW